MASERDKARMKRLAEAMDEANREAAQEAGRREPGENIAIGLALSRFWMAVGRDLGGPTGDDDEGISFVQLWHEAQKRKANSR